MPPTRNPKVVSVRGDRVQLNGVTVGRYSALLYTSERNPLDQRGSQSAYCNVPFWPRRAPIAMIGRPFGPSPPAEACFEPVHVQALDAQAARFRRALSVGLPTRPESSVTPRMKPIDRVALLTNPGTGLPAPLQKRDPEPVKICGSRSVTPAMKRPSDAKYLHKFVLGWGHDRRRW